MFSLHISNDLVQIELDGIFRRIEHAGTREAKEHEANDAWFQIFGMRKLVQLGGMITFPVRDRRDPQCYREYEKLCKMLETALIKVERIFDEYCGRPA